MKQFVQSLSFFVLVLAMSLIANAKDTYLTISYKTYGGSVECLQVEFFDDDTARMISYNANGMPTKVVSGTWTSSDRMTYIVLTFISKEGYKTSFEGMKSANGRPTMIKDGQERSWNTWGCK